MIIKELMKALHHMGIKVPSDCWHLQSEYFSGSKQEYIPVENMDIFHLLRAFSKQIETDPNLDIKNSIANLRDHFDTAISGIEERMQ